MISASRRMRELPPYVFLELQRRRERARAEGRTVYDLTVGNPTGPVCPAALETLARVIRERPEVHGYPPFRGHPALREATVRWYRRRFGVALDAEREVLPLLGSKEGLYHLLQAYLDPSDAVLVPTPCYPAYLGAARLAGAEIIEVPLLEEDDWRLRVERIDPDAARAARALLVNTPHNPTGAVLDDAQLRQIVAFARDHDLLLISDLPYAELALDPDLRPSSLLAFDGARTCTVEFQSLSKSHSMAGWRVGMALGNAEALDVLARRKSNADFGVFSALQIAAATALDEGDPTVEATRELYRRRRDCLCDGLDRLGWRVRRPRAGMYVWTRIPGGGEDDGGFARELFERSGVLLTPGSALGAAGKGFVRMSLVLDEEELVGAIDAIATCGILG